MIKIIKAKAFVFASIALAALFFFSFSSTDTPYKSLNYIERHNNEFNNAIITLDETATAFAAGNVSLDSVQRSVTATRLSYKKLEFYLAYHYPEYVKEHINGAPLLHIERKDSRAKVLQPEGLQVLDEVVYSDEAPNEKNRISFLAKQLRNHYITLHKGLKLTNDKSDGIAAVRMQMVRIYTLGLTGFDTPGSLNAIQEARVSLTGLSNYISENYKSREAAEVAIMLHKAVAYLNNKTFDELDRLEFLKKHIDPVYAMLGKMQDTVPGKLKHSTAWNPVSTSIFGTDFLDPYFFTALDEGEDSKQLRALGKDLFYDGILSADGNISCANCHRPEKAFTDGVPRSLSSIQGKTVLRNSPTLLNAVYADRYFYDLRAFTLEQQAEHVIFSNDEFNTAYRSILKKLQESQTYVNRFERVFSKKEINRDMLSKALVSYVLSLQSFNSPFDKYARGEIAKLNKDAINGFNLFMGKAACATCHFAPTFSGLVPPYYNENESEILGVPIDPAATLLKIDGDRGRLDNSIISEHAWIFENSFKTTTVRNVVLTSPYFHNGAYKTLEEVIEFYNRGGGTGLGLNVINQTLAPDPLNLTDKEKKNLSLFFNRSPMFLLLLNKLIPGS